MLSADKLFFILESIQVTPEEFVLEINHYELNYFDSLLQKIEKYLIQKNLFLLEGLLVTEKEFAKKKFRKKLHQLNCILIKSAIYSCDNSRQVEREDIIFLDDYLTGVDKWGEYELKLLSYCSPVIPAHVLLQLAKKMINRTVYYRKISQNKIRVIHVLMHVAMICIDRDDLIHGEEFILQADTMIGNSSYLLERNILLYVSGFLMLKKGWEEGTRKMKRAIQIFKDLNCEELSLYYEKRFTL